MTKEELEKVFKEYKVFDLVLLEPANDLRRKQMAEAIAEQLKLEGKKRGGVNG